MEHVDLQHQISRCSAPPSHPRTTISVTGQQAMIIEKHPLPDDPTPSEAPPSYDTLPSIPSSSSFTLDEKVNPYLQPTYPPSPQSPEPGSSVNPASPKGKWKGAKPWFPFGQAARAAREVKATVLGLIRDLVKLETSSSTSILQSCSEACNAHGLSLSSILQEKAIEGHTALYWAIVKRPPEPPSPNDNDVLTGMLALAEPLTDATISDIRLACLVTSDQRLFQRLRRSPAFAPLSGSDQMLLEASVPPDEVIVEDVPGDEGAFAVHFRLVKFQARMRVSKEIHMEYIARGMCFDCTLSTRMSLMFPQVGYGDFPFSSAIRELGEQERTSRRVLG